MITHDARKRLHSVRNHVFDLLAAALQGVSARARSVVAVERNLFFWIDGRQLHALRRPLRVS